MQQKSDRPSAIYVDKPHNAKSTKRLLHPSAKKKLKLFQLKEFSFILNITMKLKQSSFLNEFVRSNLAAGGVRNGN